MAVNFSGSFLDVGTILQPEKNYHHYFTVTKNKNIHEMLKTKWYPFPKMNLQNLPPSIMDIFLDTYQFLQIIYLKYEIDLRSLNSSE